MVDFYYKARTREGELVRGNLVAPSQGHAEKILKEKQLFILELKDADPQATTYLPFLGSKVGSETLSAFSYQVAAMLKAGLPLLNVLEISASKTSATFKSALYEMMEDLKRGENLATSMDKQGYIFPPLMSSMVEAGEMGGILEEVFDWLAIHYENETQLHQKIVSALTYPFLLFLLTIGALIFLLSFVVPSFATMLQDIGIALPVITAKIIGLSQFLREWGFYLVVFFLLAFFLFFHVLKTPQGRLKWDSFYLKIPLLGDLSTKVISSRFCHLLGTLLDKGVPILSALEVTKKTLNNTLITSGLSNAQISLKEGKRLTDPLKEMKVFPDLLLKMVEVGEETGQISQFLLKLSAFYDREVEKTLERVTKLIEPTLVLFMGGLIGAIVLALMLPLFSLLGAF